MICCPSRSGIGLSTICRHNFRHNGAASIIQEWGWRDGITEARGMTRRQHRAHDVFHAYYVVLIAGAKMAECGSSSSNLSSSVSSSTDIDEESQVVSILDRLRAPLR